MQQKYEQFSAEFVLELLFQSGSIRLECMALICRMALNDMALECISRSRARGKQLSLSAGGSLLEPLRHEICPYLQ